MPVVDASVALKWFVDEADSPSALSLRDAHVYRHTHLVAPDLIIYEVSNALLHNPRFTESTVLQAVRTLYDLQLDLIVPTAELVHTTIRLATRHKLTFYDALYLGVAQEVGMELVTADHRLHRRTGHSHLVRLLD